VPPGSSGRAAPRRRFGSGSHHIVPVGPRTAAGYGVHRLSMPVPTGPELPDGQRMTVNDLLLAATHLGVARWNGQWGQDTDVVRVRMPITAVHDSHPAGRELGNHAGQSMVITGREDRADLVGFAGRIVEQSQAAKESSVGWAGPVMRTVLDLTIAALPDRLRSVLLRTAVTAARPLLMPSVSMSNIGRSVSPRRSGGDGPRVTALYFMATAGMPQGLLIGATGFAGRLHLTFCHHRALFDRAGAARFAKIFQDALTEFAEIGPGRAPRASQPIPTAEYARRAEHA